MLEGFKLKSQASVVEQGMKKFRWQAQAGAGKNIYFNENAPMLGIPAWPQTLQNVTQIGTQTQFYSPPPIIFVQVLDTAHRMR